MIEVENFLSSKNNARLDNNQVKFLEKFSSETELYNLMSNIQNNKYPGIDGLTKEIYKNC